MGNVFNIADMSPVKKFMHQLPSGMGKIQLYVSSANPDAK